MSARVTTFCGLVTGVLVLACAKEPPPPPKTDAAVEIAAALLGPKPRGPQVLIEIEWKGHGTLEVEHAVVEPIEEAISGHVDVDGIESAASPGRARVYVTASAGTDPVALRSELRDAMPMKLLPPDVGLPTVTRADRDGRVLFAMLESSGSSADDAWRDDGNELDRIADEIARQPGVWNVRRCGQQRSTLGIQIDPARLAAFGIGLDRVIEWLETQIPTGDNDIEGMMAAFSTSIGGTLRLTSVAGLTVGPRESSCIVMGTTGRRPTLEIWATTEGLDAASKALHTDKQASRLRTWTVGDPKTPTAIVGSTLEPRDQNTIMQLWLVDDPATSSWLVRNGDDPAWLLTEETTQLRSFSRAAMVDLHVWWPGAPIPVTARICGPDLDTLVTTADALGHAMTNDELLDDVAVWAPRGKPARVFEIDREAAARRGVAASAIAPIEVLFSGEELTLATKVPIVVRIDTTDPAAVIVGSTSGPVPVSELGAMRDVREPALVQRFDRQRCATVDLQPRRDEDRAKIEAAVRERAVLPIGVTLTFAPL